MTNVKTLIKRGARVEITFGEHDEVVVADRENTHIHENEIIVRTGKFDIALPESAISEVAVLCPSIDFYNGFRRAN